MFEEEEKVLKTSQNEQKACRRSTGQEYPTHVTSPPALSSPCFVGVAVGTSAAVAAADVLTAVLLAMLMV